MQMNGNLSLPVFAAFPHMFTSLSAQKQQKVFKTIKEDHILCSIRVCFYQINENCQKKMKKVQMWRQKGLLEIDGWLHFDTILLPYVFFSHGIFILPNNQTCFSTSIQLSQLLTQREQRRQQLQNCSMKIQQLFKTENATQGYRCFALCDLDMFYR